MLCRASLKHMDVADLGMVGPKKWYEKMILLSLEICESKEWFELVSAGLEMLIIGSWWEVSLTARFAKSLPSRLVSYSDP